MKTFKYILRDESGKQYTGTYEAVSHSEVIVWARCQGRIPVLIEELDTRKKKSRKKKRNVKHVSLSEMAAFCWQIGTMMGGGVSITESLETISDDIDNEYFEKTLNSISEDIKAGSTFTDALKKHPKVFNTFFRAMSLAGETSGNMPQVFERLADYYVKREKLLKDVKGALSYPCFVAGFVVLIVTVMGLLIIPRFKSMFEMFKNELPAFTEVYMSCYDYISRNIWWMGLIIIALWISGHFYSKTINGHRNLSKLVLRLPFFNNIIINSFITTFCQTTSTLFMSGVSVLETLEIIKAMNSNDIIRESITNIQKRIEEGDNISSAIESTEMFPNLVIKMAQVGEQSGSLSNVFDKTSEQFQRQLEGSIKAMTKMIEPVMMMLVGSLVLVTVIALYLPVFTMSDV
ncbi:type II secretion system F family protein [Sedimentisphaera salicampi]|uniref:General secretion pathway protein F n=1 Tax=Sedimentisphaera salicampi TaxID=1941349 RepID=A0A1W6LIY7_9BACT|nr:type II secretion system F family protein [Sedimentisphaera salicampi]ARN55725.1 General secretion pathway protein F [Sedimentisphaera salicampi]